MVIAWAFAGMASPAREIRRCRRRSSARPEWILVCSRFDSVLFTGRVSADKRAIHASNFSHTTNLPLKMAVVLAVLAFPPMQSRHGGCAEGGHHTKVPIGGPLFTAGEHNLLISLVTVSKSQALKNGPMSC